MSIGLAKMSSFSLRPDGEPTVTATLAAEDGTYEVSPRYGSVHLKALSIECQEVLTKFDRNGDGEVDESELENVVDVLVKEQFKSRLFLCGILMLVFSLVLLLASSFGLTWAIVLVHKGTRVRGNLLGVPGSEKPVLLGDTAYTVDRRGSLVSRVSAVLGTAPLYYQLPLNANMTLGALSALVRVRMSGGSGAQVGFRVTGFSLAPGTSPPELNISTPTGTLVLRGDRLAGVAAAAGLVDSGELSGQGVTGIFSRQVR